MTDNKSLSISIKRDFLPKCFLKKKKTYINEIPFGKKDEVVPWFGG